MKFVCHPENWTTQTSSATKHHPLNDPLMYDLGPRGKKIGPCTSCGAPDMTHSSHMTSTTPKVGSYIWGGVAEKGGISREEMKSPLGTSVEQGPLGGPGRMKHTIAPGNVSSIYSKKTPAISKHTSTLLQHHFFPHRFWDFIIIFSGEDTFFWETHLCVDNFDWQHPTRFLKNIAEKFPLQGDSKERIPNGIRSSRSPCKDPRHWRRNMSMKKMHRVLINDKKTLVNWHPHKWLISWGDTDDYTDFD